MIHGNNQTQKIPLKIFLLPLILGILVIVLNTKWLSLYQLINAPRGDSLVYLTEAYNDYWTIRNGDIGQLFNKYIIAGNQQTSPLLWEITAIAFFIFGLNPLVAYLVIAFAYLTWVCGVVYLAWSIQKDILYAVACGLLAVFLPSAASHGLRTFMLDFVAAAPFIWSTGLLINSDLMCRKRSVVLYAFLVGITILFRTTSVLYFISHIVIIGIQAAIQKRHPNYRNIVIAVIVTTITCGWFIFPNIGRILGYYGYWATQAQISTPTVSFMGNAGFYLGLLRKFHLTGGAYYVYIGLIFYAVLLLLNGFLSKKFMRAELPKLIERILIIITLFIVPTTILSIYSSRAVSVDFIFIAAYLILPLLLWRTIFQNSKLFLFPTFIMLIAFWIAQFKILLQAPNTAVERIDYREREVLSHILADAEARGLSSIKLGSTAMHQHNCLSYQYWALANYFPRWTGRVFTVPMGRPNSADELARTNKDADYVIVVENFRLDLNPNNVAAPAANNILQTRYGMAPLTKRFDLPDGATVRVLHGK